MTIQNNLIQDEEDELPTVLLFDVILHDLILVYKEKDGHSAFWAFVQERVTGDYICYRCDMAGKKLPETRVYEKHDMPVFAIQEPSVSTKSANDFLDWLWVIGQNL